VFLNNSHITCLSPVWRYDGVKVNLSIFNSGDSIMAVQQKEQFIFDAEVFRIFPSEGPVTGCAVTVHGSGFVVGRFYQCIVAEREYSPLVTPIEFKENGLWSIFQEMLFRALYNIRTDLHQVKDPQTGRMITGLINYEEFRMACDAPKWMSVVKWVGIVGDAAMAFVTLGASTAFQAATTLINTAIQIVNIKDANNKAVAVYKFNKTLLDGYNASQDVANIIKPPPKLTPEEQKLADKASGVTKSPTEVVGEAKTAGGNPWLLIAGAVAAAALLS
jgi:hypothetical protein